MFFKGLEVAPDYGTAYYYIGNTYQKQGKFKQALEMYEKCIQVGGDPNVYLDMGWIYLLKRHLRKAVTSFQKCIECRYFEFIASHYLGLITRMQGKNEESRKYYELCIKLSNKLLEDDPENPYVHSSLGLAYTALGEHPKGAQQGEYAVSLDPENGAILYDLARIYALQNNPDKSIQALEKALDRCLCPSQIEAKLDPHFERLQKHRSFVKVVGK